MNPRYFIGLELPQEITEQISKLQNRLLQGNKVLEPLLPHITLLHPNILMTISPMYFVPKVNVDSQKFLPIKVELTKTALFDTRVLYIAVKSPGLIKLQNSLVNLLPSDIQASYTNGLDFTPHVTLAQAKSVQKLDPVMIESFQEELHSLLPYSFEVKSLTEFKSHGPRKYQASKI